jgi:hypothetical protein
MGKGLLSFWFVVGMALPAWPQEPPVILQLGDRHGHGVPHRAGCTHLGGGNIEVEQPDANEIRILMRGAVVATGHPFTDSRADMEFDLDQELKVVFREPDKVKAAKLTMEGKLIGLLRSQPSCHEHRSGGSAGCGPACAELLCGDKILLALCVPPHGVGGGENLSINCQKGLAGIPIVPGCYRLHQTFNLGAAHPHGVLPCWPASAEFSPGALNEKWIGYWEPFHGANKSKFGFQILLRVEPEEASELPAPKPSK